MNSQNYGQNAIPRPLHICVISQQFSNVISGVGIYTNNLISNLIAQGHHVSIIVPQNQKPEWLITCPIYTVPGDILLHNQARWMPLSYYFARTLPLVERENPIDIYHFTDAREALFAKTKIPIIGNVNDTYSINIQKPSYYKKYYSDWITRWIYYLLVHYFEKITFQRQNALIANSHFTYNMIIEKYHLCPSHVFTIHKSIDIKNYQHNFRTINTENPQRVLFIGGNMQRKGLPILIKASKYLINTFPNIEFWIVGKDKAEFKMKTLTQKIGVDQYFKFWGWQDRNSLMQIFSQSSIFTLPSLTESFGVVILEAMASGLPVVATDVGGIPEIITSEENGIIVPPSDPLNLADAIARLLSNPTLRSQIVENAFKTVIKFDVSNMMEKTYNVYKKILNMN